MTLDEPERLVMRTWINCADGAVRFEVEHRARFEEIDGRTLMRFGTVVIQARADAVGPLSGMETGWRQSFDKLERHLRALNG